MSKQIVLLICILAWPLLTSLPAHSAKLKQACIYPALDGGEPNASKPSIVGDIIQRKGNVLTIKSDTSSLKQNVRFNKDTYLSTIYGGGGFISTQVLQTRLHTYIWYVGCVRPKLPALPVAKIIQMDSTVPGLR